MIGHCLLIMTFLAVSALGCSAQSRAGSVPPDLAECLKSLRAVHDLEEPIFSPCAGSEEIDALKGLSRTSIISALGDPTWAGEDEATYNFYRFPPPERAPFLGGGATLWLRFDATGFCADACWRYSR